MYLGVLFDVYGTLVRYPGFGLVEQFRRELAACGQNVEPAVLSEACEDLVGEFMLKQANDAVFEYQVACRLTAPNHWLRRRLIELLGLTGDLGCLSAAMYREYLLLPDFVLDPEVRGLLMELKSLGLKLGIISNGPSYVNELIERHGLSSLVDAVVVSEDVGYHKPHRRIFLLTLERLGLKPDSCIYVGDNPHTDVVGAQNAGLRSVLIDPAGNFKDAFLFCPHIARLAELLDIVASPKEALEQKAAALA